MSAHIRIDEILDFSFCKQKISLVTGSIDTGSTVHRGGVDTTLASSQQLDVSILSPAGAPAVSYQPVVIDTT